MGQQFFAFFDNQALIRVKLNHVLNSALNVICLIESINWIITLLSKKHGYFCISMLLIYSPIMSQLSMGKVFLFKSIRVLAICLYVELSVKYYDGEKVFSFFVHRRLTRVRRVCWILCQLHILSQGVKLRIHANSALLCPSTWKKRILKMRHFWSFFLFSLQLRLQ